MKILDPQIKIDKLIQAMRVLFGKEFFVLPTFSYSEHDKLQDILGDAMQRNLLNSLGEQRIRLWLQECAETHPVLQRLEDVLMASWSWQKVGENILKLKVAQFPDVSRWLALSDEEIEMNMTTEEKDLWISDRKNNGRPMGNTSTVILTTDKPNLTTISGLMVEAWSETIPESELETGISFQYNGPNAQAPQVLLLAVPKPNKKPEYWTMDKLIQTLGCANDLMKIRMVDLDALGSLRNYFPATFMPFDPSRPGWSDAEVVLPDLNQWLERFKH